MSKKYVYLFSEGNANMRELLGGKGANLAEMTNIGLPVPQGFTITTEACTQYYEDGQKINDGIQAEIMEYITKLEGITGKKFGDLENPLLVSVRSGARASMPGMMDTILNLGLNEDVVDVLAKKSGNPRWAWDCYRRFIQMYSDVVMEVGKKYFEQLIDAMKEKRGVKLSYNDIMAKAIAVASRKFPLVNARYEDGEVRIYRHTNIGLAVALEGALVVPVVREIDEKGLEQIAGEYKQQIKKAREGKLAPADMGCGSITISNLGMYDVDQFIAIVNPPESCILAVGSIRVEPVWGGNDFRPVHRMSVTGSFDHRIIDGAYGAQFLQELKALMEAPALMLH